MIARRIRGILIICFAALAALLAHPTPTARIAAQSPCDGLVAPRLQTSGTARVTSIYGLSLKNRPATGAAGATELALLPFGTVVTVMDGYTCNFGYVWWQVRLPDGTTGWIAEGSAGEYFAEPFSDRLNLFRPNDDRTRIDRYAVTRDGTAEYRGSFAVTLPPVTPGDVWQQVEIDRLAEALETLRTECPDRLGNSPLAGVTALDDALRLSLPPSEYDFYPSPSGERILLVRHYHLLVPRCDTVIPERVGISTVSVLDATGSETALFPFPQHGSVPPSQDTYAETEPDPWSVYLDEVVWSPHETYIAFVAAYRDRCEQACFRFHIYIANLDTGQLTNIGEGRHLAWTNGGEGINFFRLSWTGDGRQKAHLYTSRADGSALQEIWLPGGAHYVSPEQRALNLPWNTSGTRVMVANAGMAEVMLFKLDDRAFTPPVTVPDRMPQLNRLSVHIIRGETAFLWTTIRGNFVIQDVRTGQWRDLNSEVASTGIAPRRVEPFATGDAALVTMADGTAYVLDLVADRLIPVTFERP